MVDMFLGRLEDYYDIIQVYPSRLLSNRDYVHLNGSSECASRISEPERHLCKSVWAVMGCEGGLVLLFVINLHSPITAVCI